jgi:hypothetical protein
MSGDAHLKPAKGTAIVGAIPNDEMIAAGVAVLQKRISPEIDVPTARETAAMLWAAMALVDEGRRA